MGKESGGDVQLAWALSVVRSSVLKSVRGLSLPNRNLYVGDKDVRLGPAIDFSRVSRLEEQVQGFSQILARLFDSASLTGYVEFRAKGNVHIALPLNQRGQTTHHGHTPILQPIANRKAKG